MLKNNLISIMEKASPDQARTEGIYGPGSWTDTSFTPVPKECQRLLAVLARDTPGFTKDHRLLDNVTFEGDDLPIIPGPLKSQALTAVFHAMAGIIGQEIRLARNVCPSPRVESVSHLVRLSTELRRRREFL